MANQRIDILNGMRGLAASAVALEHFVLFATLAKPSDLMFQVCVYVGSVAVAVFFLISGFVTPIAFGSTGPRDFLIRRFFRLYPVFFVCCAARLVVGLSMGKVPSDFTTLKQFLLTISLFGGLFLDAGSLIEPVVWTLEIEVKFYLLCTLVIRLSGRQWANVNRLVLGTLALMALLAFNFPALGEPWTLDLGYAASIAPFMLGAFFVSMHFNGHITTADLILGLVCSSCAFFMAPLRYFMTPSALSGFAIAGAIFAAALIWRDALTFMSGRVLTFLGSISYPMYGVHSAVAIFLAHYMPAGKTSLKLAVYIPLLLLVSYAIHRFIEMPSIAFSKRLTSNRKMLGSSIRAVPQ